MFSSAVTSDLLRLSSGSAAKVFQLKVLTTLCAISTLFSWVLPSSMASEFRPGLLEHNHFPKLKSRSPNSSERRSRSYLKDAGLAEVDDKLIYF